MRRKNVMIVGGGGYVGTMLAGRLIERGYVVKVVDQFWFGNHFGQKQGGNLFLVKKNALDLTAKDIKDTPTVVFLAGVSNDPMAEFKPQANFVENSAVPAFLAYLFKKNSSFHNQKRFIYASSCSVYGYSQNKLMGEKSKIEPQFPYGISKLLGEKGVMGLESRYFRPISLRKGTIGGWSPRMRFDLVVNAMTKSALTKKEIDVHNPTLWRPLLDIRDATEAYVRAIESNLEISGIYNISQGNYTIGRLADIVKSTVESETGDEIKLNIGDKEDMRNYKVSNRKAALELDFVAKHAPDSTVKSILKNVDNNFNFNDKQYYNIEIFKELNV